jgi:hypothetical protein
MSRTIDDEEFFARACEAYRRHCRQHNLIVQQPTAGGEIDGDTITLSNMHGALATYRWTGTRVERVEEEL